MDGISILEVIGVILFILLAIELASIQLRRLVKFRWPIFVSCMICYAGITAIIWLTYESYARTPPSPYAEFMSAYNKNDTTDDADPNAPKPFSDCAECPAMITIPAGEITVAKLPDTTVELPSTPFRVHFTKKFAVSRNEISVKEFEIFARETGFTPSGPCNTDGVGGASADFHDPGLPQSRHHPVVCVSIQDAQRYVSWLSARAKVPYGLLSETRWEYVRRGITGRENTADLQQDSVFPEQGNIKWDGWTASTTPAGRYEPNAFGVHDMMGNAAEWTADCWHEDLSTVPANGDARKSTGDCSAHAVRGGSWDDRRQKASPTRRVKMIGAARDWRVGFRVMRAVTNDIVASR